MGSVKAIIIWEEGVGFALQTMTGRHEPCCACKNYIGGSQLGDWHASAGGQVKAAATGIVRISNIHLQPRTIQ